MSEECNGSCGSCSSASSCSSAQGQEKKSPYAQLNKYSKVKHVVAVVSGKGGVGKSLVTGLLASAMNQRGYHVGILDADMTGPSIPKMFGVKGHLTATEQGAFPLTSKQGIEIVSTNLLLDDETDPVIWRGPLIAGSVQQFWSDLVWQDIDFMFIDMPPGTGDVPLTVFKSIKVDGIVIVTSPQELVSMIVTKAVKMAQIMNVPIIGLVENMSYFQCPSCGEKHYIYGKSNIGEIADAFGLPVLAQIPMDPQLATACDSGVIDEIEVSGMKVATDVIEALEKKD